MTRIITSNRVNDVILIPDVEDNIDYNTIISIWKYFFKPDDTFDISAWINIYARQLKPVFDLFIDWDDEVKGHEILFIPYNYQDEKYLVIRNAEGVFTISVDYPNGALINIFRQIYKDIRDRTLYNDGISVMILYDLIDGNKKRKRDNN
jgi:hypothetical protein